MVLKILAIAPLAVCMLWVIRFSHMHVSFPRARNLLIWIFALGILASDPSHNLLFVGSPVFLFFYPLTHFSNLALYAVAYLFFRELTGRNYTTSTLWLCLLPSLFFMLAYMVVFFIPVSEVDSVVSIIYNRTPLNIMPDVISRILFFLRYSWNFAILAEIIVFSYLIFKEVREFSKNVHDYFSGEEIQDIVYVRNMFIATCILMLTDFFKIQQDLFDLHSSVYITAIECSLFAIANFALAANSDLFHLHIEQNLNKEGPSHNGDDLQRIALLKDKIYRCMDTDNLYRKVNLSLQNLADHIGEPSKDVTFIFRKILNTSFESFVNQYRMEDAKRIIVKKSLDVQREEVANSCGFGNAKAMEAAFRKYAKVSVDNYIINKRLERFSGINY